MKRITYNKLGTIESPTLILSSVAHKHYGVINNVDQSTISFNFNMNSSQEVSFEVYKELNGIECDLWDKIVSLRYVYIPEHKEYYKMDVTTEEGDKTVKKCVLTSASEYELGNKYIESMEINTEYDFDYEEVFYNPDEYATTVLFIPNAVAEGKEKQSLLHRATMDFAPDWSIGHVDETIRNIQRSFSVTGQSVYDFLVNTVAKEIECLFKFDSVNRVISVYDLLNTCTNHKPYYRGNFTHICPKCNSGDYIVKGYGKDTGIYISYENYSESMTVDGDEANVKNCFYVTGGDDYVTNILKLSNPNYSNFIYNFSQMDYDDMSEELKTELDQYEIDYNTKLPEFQQHEQDFFEYNNQYWWYNTSMMPRSNSTRWKAHTNYTQGDSGSRVYTSTMPAWGYLQCIKTGQSGNREFDCTNVTVGQIIKDGDENTGVQWLVCKNITDTSSAQQQAQVVKNYLSSHPVMFMDGVTSSASVAATHTKNIGALAISSFYRIETISGKSGTITDIVRDPSTGKIKSAKWSGELQITALNADDDVYVPTAPADYFVATLKMCETDQEYLNYQNDQVSARASKDDKTYTTIFKETDVATEKDYVGITTSNITTGSTTNPIVVNGKNVTVKSGDWAFNETVVNGLVTNFIESYWTGSSWIQVNSPFTTALTTYSLDRLKSFYQTYSDIISVLTSQGINNPNYTLHGVSMYVPIYLPNLNKQTKIEAEIKRREAEVNRYDALYKDAKQKMLNISKTLNMKNYLGEDLYKMFHSYLRIGTYQNSNYISGNQSDAAILSDVNTLMELAQTELKKACELQYTLSDNLHNLLNTKGFSNFKDEFEIGDYIICRADDILYRLRLIQVQYNYDKPEDISVTFSNVTKLSNYFSDVQSVLNQAQTMGNSYEIVEHQVDKNAYTTTTVNGWLDDGLNTSLARVKSNVQEEVEINNTGILCRSKDDVSEIYSDEQFRIQHNVLAFTNNNWETVKTAIGKCIYTTYNEEQHRFDLGIVGYGMNADFVTAGQINGGQIIGSQIYSSNYSESPAAGTHLNLTDGTFTMGGGSLKWDTSNGLYVNGSGTFTGTINATGGTFTNVTATNLTATNSTFTGTVHASLGDIGGWQINNNGLYSTNSLSVVTPTSIGVGNSSEGSNTITKDGFYQTNNNYCQSEIGKYTFRNGTHYGVFVHPTTVPYAGKFVTLTETGNIWSSGDIYCGGSADPSVAKESCHGTIYCGTVVCTDTKPKLIETQSYGKRLQYAYETPTPLFGDIGEGIIDETGVCIIYIDDIFAETANTNCDYQVFLQSYSEYNCYVSERTPSYFVVIGEPNTTFGWEIKAVQRDYETYRLDVLNEYEEEMDTDNSINDVWNYLDELLYNVDEEEI